MSDSPNLLLQALKTVVEARLTLSREDARALLDYLLDHMPAAELQAAALLGAMAARGETENELAGFVDALRARSIRLPLTEDERERIVDTCGTGGDLSGTFNISTAAALVAAAAGAWVAKHGNRAVTSKCGSADVLEALGIPVDHTPESVAQALRTHGFAFMAAPDFQPAMRAMMPLRRALGVRTAFNVLGPMTNPAGAAAQVVGVYAPGLVPVVAATLALLTTRSALVVHGGGMDEFSNIGATIVGQVIGDQAQFGTIEPDAFGMEPAMLEQLAGGDAATNAAILRAIFAGEAGPRRDIVLINAAAVLVVADLAEDFLNGVKLAAEAIDSGSVARLVEALAARV